MYSSILVASFAVRVLTLEQAIETAQANHPQLRVAAAQVDSAYARAAGQRAGLLPQLSASARYGVAAGDAQNEGFASFDIGQSYSAGLSGSMLLWDFNRTKDKWRAAKLGADAQALSRDATVQDIVLDVELAYFEARAQKELVAVARDTLDNEERHLAQVQAFVDIGSRPEIDVARVRTTVANAKAALIRAENNYAVAKAQLNNAMGVTAQADYDIADQQLPALPGEDRSTAEMVDQAISQRPEFAELAAEIRAQKLTLRQAKKGLWPSLRLSADTSYSGTHFSDPGWGAGIGISLSWPLFDGHATSNQVRVEELSLVVLDAQKEALRQSIWLEIDQARLAVRSTKAAAVAASQALESARELLGLAEGRYEAGVGDIIELGDAQVSVTTASAQVVQTEYDLASARARLARALGGDTFASKS